eukprot:2275046-Pleurochrysis_carterae.AAC.7
MDEWELSFSRSTHEHACAKHIQNSEKKNQTVRKKNLTLLCQLVSTLPNARPASLPRTEASGHKLQCAGL